MRIVRQIWADILRLSSSWEPAKTVVGFMIAIGALAGALYVGRDWLTKPLTAPRITALIAALCLVFACYVVSVAVRSRRPLLAVGRLEADIRKGSHLFHVRVKNLGPGEVKPIAKITYLRDGNGAFLPFASSYTASEICWRFAEDGNWRPTLAQGDENYAVVLCARGVESESPQLFLHLSNLRPVLLWDDEINLQNQTGLKIRITISFEGQGNNSLAVERCYLIRPDARQPLKYKARRVWIRSLFWH